MQGWSPDFVANLVEDAVTANLIDRLIPVAGADALACSKALARQEGIFTGITGGATFAGAREVCRNAPEGSTVLCMLPDTGERYLSTPLFEDIHAEVSDEENEISRSTPSARFDVSMAAPRTASTDEGPETDAEASTFFEEVIRDPEQPVVMFALEWCEFSWSIRKLLARMNAPYRSVDLDSAACQRDDMGGASARRFVPIPA